LHWQQAFKFVSWPAKAGHPGDIACFAMGGPVSPGHDTVLSCF
jgi:hypothetical protein